MEGEANDAIPDHIVQNGDIDVLCKANILRLNVHAIEGDGLNGKFAGKAPGHVIDH